MVLCVSTNNVPSSTGPSGVGEVVVSDRTSTSMFLSWQQPSVPNGLVIRYNTVAMPTSTVGLDTPTGNPAQVSLDVTVSWCLKKNSISSLFLIEKCVDVC